MQFLAPVNRLNFAPRSRTYSEETISKILLTVRSRLKRVKVSTGTKSAVPSRSPWSFALTPYTTSFSESQSSPMSQSASKSISTRAS